MYDVQVFLRAIQDFVQRAARVAGGVEAGFLGPLIHDPGDGVRRAEGRAPRPAGVVVEVGLGSMLRMSIAVSRSAS